MSDRGVRARFEQAARPLGGGVLHTTPCLTPHPAFSLLSLWDVFLLEITSNGIITLSYLLVGCLSVPTLRMLAP